MTTADDRENTVGRSIYRQSMSDVLCWHNFLPLFTLHQNYFVTQRASEIKTFIRAGNNYIFRSLFLLHNVAQIGYHLSVNKLLFRRVVCQKGLRYNALRRYLFHFSTGIFGLVLCIAICFTEVAIMYT
jgi:hypothetical protein